MARAEWLGTWRCSECNSRLGFVGKRMVVPWLLVVGMVICLVTTSGHVAGRPWLQGLYFVIGTLVSLSFWVANAVELKDGKLPLPRDQP